MSRLEVLVGEVKGAQRLLERWKPGVMDGLLGKLSRWREAIEGGEFPAVERGLADLDDRLKTIGGEVRELQGQDEQRREVLEALREVCTKEMGWREQGGPVLEEVGKPGSALVYEVETYVARRLKFRLTLAGIQVTSGISREGDVCYREFDNLSERLKGYGVMTRFRPVEAEEELPRLKESGARDLPQGGASSSFAGSKG